MSQVFLHIVNISISASVVIVAVLVLRSLLKKAPKWTAVLLWSIVAIRLICPFSFESAFSLIPSAETVSPSIITDTEPKISTGFPTLNSAVNPIISSSFSPAQEGGTEKLQILITVLTAVWIAGIIAFAVYTFISYIKVKRNIGTAVLFKDNIYKSENVSSPFVLGIIKPKIYLPVGISEKDMPFVVAHEQAHIRRKDHLWKPFGFLLLTLYWFNPLMWLGYILLCKDIELACDEKVIKDLDHAGRADYSETLLSCSVNRKMISACPIAFGEVGVRSRVKSILSYKKPAFWIIIVAVITCAVCAVCFLTNPKEKPNGETEQSIEELMKEFPEYFGVDPSDGLDIYACINDSSGADTFVLLPHSEKHTQMYYYLSSSEKAFSFKFASTSQMREIINYYNVSPEDVHIIPFLYPLSGQTSKLPDTKNQEDYDAQLKAYTDYIRRSLFELDSPRLVYDDPNYSYLISFSLVPRASVKDGILYSENGKRLGEATEITLKKSNFDNFMITEFNGRKVKTGKQIRSENKVAYKITPTSPDGVDLYYVLIQKNGDTLIVYGHYDTDGNPEKTIRWIFKFSAYACEN